MAVLARIGERVYEFETTFDVAHARSVYAVYTGSQDEFESTLELEGIDFFIEFDG